MRDYDYLVELGQEYLAHYGVLGMKWGVRKSKEYIRDVENARYKKLKKKDKSKKHIYKQQRNQNILTKIKKMQEEYKAGLRSGLKSKDISNKYLKEAKNEISNYMLKRGVKKVANKTLTAISLASLLSGGGVLGIAAKDAAGSITSILGRKMVTNPNLLYEAGRTAKVGAGLLGVSAASKITKGGFNKVYDATAIRPKKKKHKK